MKSGQQNGYTIVEAMIFIAVSAGLFFIAMTAISGRQQQVQFTQAVRGFDSQIKDLMNDVSTGYFPSLGSVSCSISLSAPAGTPPTLGIPAADEDAEQGTSDSCTFIGKALQFGPEISGNVQNDRILVHTLIGRRTNATRGDVTGLAQANPVTVSPRNETDTLPDFTQQIVLDWGLRITRVVVPTGSGNTTFGTIGLFNTFSDTQSADPIAESQVVDLGAIPGTRIGDTQYDAVSFLNNITDGDVVGTEQVVELNPQGGVVICLGNSDGDREAAITLSSSSRRLSSTVTFDQVDAAICG